jgi:transcriptional regulator with XRE-family HTH domain
LSLSVGGTISAIRKRLGKTMVEFARLIGSSHSTVSGYESGTVRPSKSMLILLLLLAKGDEKKPLLTALGVDDDAQIQRTFEGALDTILEYERASVRSRKSAAKDAGLREFAKEAAAVISSGVPLDPSVAEVLRRLRAQGSSRQIQARFRTFLAYLDIAAAESKHPAKSKDRTSRPRK